MTKIKAPPGATTVPTSDWRNLPAEQAKEIFANAYGLRHAIVGGVWCYLFLPNPSN